MADFGGIGNFISGIMAPIGTIGGLIQNQKNFELQKENQQYQRDLQQQIFLREDNAIQRRAKDLQAAGLSKTLAAGSGASAGAIVKSEAPQKDLKPYEQLTNMAPLIMGLMKQKADIDKTQAQTDLINSQSEGQNFTNSLNNATKVAQADKIKLEQTLKHLEVEIKEHNVSMNRLEYAAQLLKEEKPLEFSQMNKFQQEIAIKTLALDLQKHNLSIHQSTGTSSNTSGGQFGHLMEMLTSVLQMKGMTGIADTYSD